MSGLARTVTAWARRCRRAFIPLQNSSRRTSPNAISGTVASMYSRTNLPAAYTVSFQGKAGPILTLGYAEDQPVNGQISIKAMARVITNSQPSGSGSMQERTVALDVVESPAIKADVSPQKRQPGRDIFSNSLLHITAKVSCHCFRRMRRWSGHAWLGAFNCPWSSCSCSDLRRVD